MANCARLIRRSLDIFRYKWNETRGESFRPASLTNNPILILKSKKVKDGLKRYRFNISEKTLLFNIFKSLHELYVYNIV